MMMVLGLFVFQLRTVPYQQLQYQRNWRHVTNNRVNRRPTTQFLGPDNDQLTLSGVLMPEVTGGRLSATSRSLSWPSAGAARNTPSKPNAQSSGRMQKSFCSGRHTL